VSNAWQRWFWLWDLFFSLGCVAMVVVLLEQPGATTTDHVVSLGALAAMALWYVLYGRPHVTAEEEAPARGRIFMAGNMALLVLGVAFEPSMSFALFGVCSLAFMSLSLREAIVFVVPANLVPAVSALAEGGFRAMIGQLVPGTLFLIVFSVMLGTWISQIVSQSQDRAVLIKELEESREEVGRLSPRGRGRRGTDAARGRDPRHARTGLHQPADAGAGRGVRTRQ
jgi:hypothetical protein